MGIAGCKLAGLEISSAQISIGKSGWTLPLKKMEPQPATIAARDALCFAKESDEQKEHEVSIDLSLELEIADKILGRDFAGAVLELKRGVERMIDLFHERNERTDIVVAQSGARIVALELFDQPARIINTDVKTIVGRCVEMSGPARSIRGPICRPGSTVARSGVDQSGSLPG